MVQKINYEEWGKIRFRIDDALFADGPGRFPLSFFHLGLFFQKAVEMHVVEGGVSRRIIYDQSYFDMPADSVARQLPKGAGFAGLQHPGGARRRARLAQERLGRLPRRRLFPRDRRVAAVRPFRARRRARRRGRRPARGISRLHQFLHRLQAETTTRVTLYALMEGPSIVGAYKFVMQRAKAVIMDIETTLFTRAAGLALRHRAADLDVLVLRDQEGDRDRLASRGARFRRAVHVDGQRRAALAAAQQSAAHHGLGVLRQQSARLRPLPARPRVRSLPGRRQLRPPSDAVGRAAAEPRQSEGWGKGSIQLCEIPTDDEIHDNIVAMWVPEKPVPAGAELDARLSPLLGRRRAVPAQARPRASRRGSAAAASPACRGPKGVRKFVVEFLGGPLATLPYGVKPEMVTTASRGSLQGYRIIEAVPDDVARPLARRIRPHGRRRRSGRDALLPAVGRADADRDLDVPVSSVLTGSEARAR